MSVTIESLREFFEERINEAYENGKLHQMKKMVERSEILYDKNGFVRFDEGELSMIVSEEIEALSRVISEHVMKDEIDLSKLDCYSVEELIDQLT